MSIETDIFEGDTKKMKPQNGFAVNPQAYMMSGLVPLCLTSSFLTVLGRQLLETISGGQHQRDRNAESLHWLLTSVMIQLNDSVVKIMKILRVPIIPTKLMFSDVMSGAPTPTKIFANTMICLEVH